MFRPHALLLFAVAGGVMAQEPTVPETPPAIRDAPAVVGDDSLLGEANVTMSRNGRFLVYGDNIELRRAVQRLGDEAHEEFLLLFQSERSDEPKSNVVVELLPGRKGGAAMKLELLQLEGAADPYRLNLYVNLARGIDNRELQRELLRMSLIEMALRGVEDSSDRDWTVPEWLVLGIAEAIAWRNDQGDRELYQAVMESGATLPLQDLLTLRRDQLSDPITRMAFRVWSGALVMAILDSGEVPTADARQRAREGFRDFFAQAVGYEGEMEVLLRNAFPDLGLSPNSLKKIVALKLANLTRARLDERMNVEQTERELNRILRPTIKTASNVAEGWIWEALPTMELEARAEAVSQTASRLIRLSYRSFPLHKEVILGYGEVMTLAANGEQEKMQQKLDELEQIRKRLREDASRAKLVLDWYEVNARKTVSGDLMDYVKLREASQTESARRSDPLSRYLDDAQRVYGVGK